MMEFEPGLDYENDLVLALSLGKLSCCDGMQPKSSKLWQPL